MITECKSGRGILFIFSLLLSVQITTAGEVCELKFTDCAEQFNNDTIVVPQKVVALSSSITACNTTISDTTGTPPSIVFVIDNSGSMKGTAGTNANDGMGSRFTVTKAMLDSIYKVQPAAEVGIVVFSGHLYFDTQSSDYFTSYFSALPQTYDNLANQAYLKLLKLNGNYGGKNGIDIIKDVLKTDTVSQTRGSDYVDLVYKPTFELTLSTNINIAFIAAKDALSKAVNVKDRQFVIFLSDGEPQGDFQASLPINDFQNGTGMPTTFTAFFTSNNTAPQSLTTMTNNIRQNGYSATNPNSDLWAIQTSYTSLLKLLIDILFDDIIISGNPSRMVINGTQSVNVSDNAFIFPGRFPLKPNVTTFLTTTSYSYTDTTSGIVRDTNVNLNFAIRRSSSAPPLPDGVTLTCWQQPDLQFYYNGSPISVINEQMAQVQIHLNPNEENITLANVSISSSLEKANYTLTQSNGVWSSPVNRATATRAVSGDHIIQNTEGDSLVAIYRNPELPLDTVRIAVPIVDNRGPEIQRAIYYPGVFGTKDTIRITFSKPVSRDLLLNAIPSGSFVYTDNGVVNNNILNGSELKSTYSTDFVQEVTIIVNPGLVQPITDSLSLVGNSASVSDRSGNLPARNNPKIPIEWGTDNSITIASSTNPFIPGETEISPIVRQQYATVVSQETTTGIVIGISSLIPLDLEDNSNSFVKIYDAVGNLLVQGLKIGQGKTAGQYGIYWNGKNKNGRTVGAGTYLMDITLRDVKGKTSNDRIKIGVQR